jgi:hypothetical protein
MPLKIRTMLKSALVIANINLQNARSDVESAGGAGLSYTVYNLSKSVS